jgi:hypothetical protein
MEPEAKAKFEGTWQHGDKKVAIKLSLIIFEEDGNTVVYCPALDLSGYGQTESDATESFKVVTSEYMLYATNKNTLLNDLKAHGWILPKQKKQTFIPPDISTLLTTNSEFNRIFNHFPYRKIDQEFAIPA